MNNSNSLALAPATACSVQTTKGPRELDPVTQTWAAEDSQI